MRHLALWAIHVISCWGWAHLWASTWLSSYSQLNSNYILSTQSKSYLCSISVQNLVWLKSAPISAKQKLKIKKIKLQFLFTYISFNLVFLTSSEDDWPNLPDSLASYQSGRERSGVGGRSRRAMLVCWEYNHGCGLKDYQLWLLDWGCHNLSNKEEIDVISWSATKRIF